MPEFGKFFLPGPTEVHPDILERLTLPMIAHRGPDMVALMGALEEPLRALFRTRRPVYVSTSSASGLMEAALRNCAQKRVLSLVCGAFSDRFYKIAVACGIEADRVEVEWGEANEAEAVAAALAGDEYEAVTVVHSETSTGVLNPVAEIAAIVRAKAPGTLLLVDCVSSLAAAPVEVDGWELDFALTGSQKALALPPGLALGVASQRAYDRSLDMPGRGLYFSFEAFEGAAAKQQTTNTPAISLLYALRYQLERIEVEGLEARWARHGDMAKRTWDWVDAMREEGSIDLRVLAPEGRRSPAVTCVLLPNTFNGVEIAGRIAERGYTIAPGYGKLKQRMFRIGHMGDHTMGELEDLLESLRIVIMGE